nr:DUF882 domain-containing protein [Rhizobium populisoli]
MQVSRTAILTFTALFGSASLAVAEDRALKLYFTHTGERATITYKRDGRFDSRGMAQINRFLRDWRRNENARMDPRLLDLVWEVYDRSGASDYIHVVSAYRSPATNAMLRGRSRNTGVAKQSQHMLGKAMDFYIPGVKLATLRALAMQVQVGGVGYYPTSGSPFVHLDVGNVRAWPRMSRQELARIFPSGKTMHLPADGRPLPGYEQAVADYRRRVGSQSIQIASTAPDDDDDDAAPARVKIPVLTAMLPTPKSRAEAALAEQTAPPAARIEAKPEFADLASLAVPTPAIRPVISAPTDPIVTASLGPAPVLAALPSFARPAPRLELREPTGSIASLPLPEVEIDEEEEFDGQEALISWALSSPGSSVGLLAPVAVYRIIPDTAAETPAVEAASPPPATTFDHNRFSSDS